MYSGDRTRYIAAVTLDTAFSLCCLRFCLQTESSKETTSAFQGQYTLLTASILLQLIRKIFNKFFRDVINL